MTAHLTLKEGGPWWEVVLSNTAELAAILNSGSYNETKIWAVMLHPSIVYDFSLKLWRS